MIVVRFINIPGVLSNQELLIIIIRWLHQPKYVGVAEVICFCELYKKELYYGRYASYYRGKIRESVDSLCRDDVDMPKPPYKRKSCNLPNIAFVSLLRKIIVIPSNTHTVARARC